MRDRMMFQMLTIIVCVCVAGAGGAAARVIYVDGAATGANDGSSWADAYVYLQDALAEASPADKPIEIRVAQGVYTPVDRNTPFELFDGVVLKGGYAGVAGVDPNARDVARHTTVLNGDLNGDDEAGSWMRPDDSAQIVACRETDASVTIDGFTLVGAARMGISIENGSATIRDCTFRDIGLYGVEALDSRLVLVNCQFTENRSVGIYGWNCHAVLTGCVFERNGVGRSGRVAILCPNRIGLEGDKIPSHLVLTDCTFRENKGEGIEVTGTCDLTRCSFTGNDGTAVRCWGPVTARRCTFVANTGSRAGAIQCLKDFTLGDVEPDCTVLDCEFIGNEGSGGGGGGALSAEGNSLTATRCLFAGNTADAFMGGGAITNGAKVMRLSHCSFTGNMSRGDETGFVPGGVGAVSSEAVVSLISNCTFAGNRGEPNTFEFRGVSDTQIALTHCIVWDGADPFAGEVSADHSNVQGGWPGEGNFEAEPCFVAPGYWDDRATDDPEDDIWVMGDYHLKSQAGHWDRGSESWVLDDITSPCIDAGDPNGPLGTEPFPNGGYVNLGAYGGTSQASRSYFGAPVCESQIAGDINGDCVVDDLDLDMLMSHWLMPDIGKANVPPSITVISPADGAELTSATPTVLRAEASDPDGTIIGVYYYAICRDNGIFAHSGIAVDPTDNWTWQAKLVHQGTYVVWAEAIDDDGARTVSPGITVILHAAGQE